MAELLEDIGHNIRRLRGDKGWNQTELGFRADTSPSIISLIENGKRNPSTATLAKIAGALGVEVVDLFPKTPSSSLEPSFNDLENELRREYDFQATRDGLDRFNEHWQRRLSKRDLNRQAFDDLGVTIETWVPALTTALAAEWNELAAAAGSIHDSSVIWPAVERFLRLGEDLAQAEREMYGEDMEAEKRRGSFEVLEGMRNTA